MTTVKVKLEEGAVIPAYMTEGAACFDLYSGVPLPVYIEPGQQEMISTGVSFEIPEDHVMLLFSRSGHANKSGIRLSNCVGVIDADYRGIVKVMLRNDSDKLFMVGPNERIAQALVVYRPKVKLVTGDLSETLRGIGGFGSTGVMSNGQMC